MKEIKILILLILCSLSAYANSGDTTVIVLGTDAAKRVYAELIISEELRQEVDDLNAEMVVVNELYLNGIATINTQKKIISSLISENASFEKSNGMLIERITELDTDIKKQKTKTILVGIVGAVGIVLSIL